MTLALGSPAFFLNHTASQALGPGAAGERRPRPGGRSGSRRRRDPAGPFPVDLALVLAAAEVVRWLVFSVFIRAEAGRSMPADWWMGPAAFIPGVIVVSIIGWTLWGLSRRAFHSPRPSCTTPGRIHRPSRPDPRDILEDSPHRSQFGFGRRAWGKRGPWRPFPAWI